MNTLIANIFVAAAVTATNAGASAGNEYTARQYAVNACELFAQDAYAASIAFKANQGLPGILHRLDNMPVAQARLERAFQAIQLVWKHQLDNPIVAHSLAMGLCIKPHSKKMPWLDPWINSPRTYLNPY